MKLSTPLMELHQARLKALTGSKYLAAFEALQNCNGQNSDSVWKTAKQLMPWKKGPFNFFGKELDAEWRCDKKWQRLAPHLPDLSDKLVLDLGCGNGWYMQQLRLHGANEVIGFDPMPLNLMQWSLLQKVQPDPQQEFYLLGLEELPQLINTFDMILSFGVLYHHRSPIQQLIDLRESLIPGGTLFLETIGIPGEDNHCLIPQDRYANMPNVWFLPTLKALKTMLERAKFTGIEVLATHWDGVNEQRATDWTTGPSYQDVLNTVDPTKTIEGHPAPMRFMLKAERKKIS